MQSIEFARSLRRRETGAEAKLWARLRNRGLGVKFRRQVPVGRYYADFLCNELKLIVELDGTQHADERFEYDRARTITLKAAGYTVMRFWNRQVLTETDDVVASIGTMIDHLRRRPSPEIKDFDLSHRER